MKRLVVFALLLSASAHAAGSWNTNYGQSSLMMNTTGGMNGAFGFEALQGDTSGAANSAFGFQSLLNNSTGSQNTGMGYMSLLNVTTSSNNSGFGQAALINVTTGAQNTGLGAQACEGIGTGNYNICIGAFAGIQIPSATSNAIIIGSNYGSTVSSNQIMIADGAGNERARFDANGKLGIGTSTPQATLDVKGTVRMAKYSAQPFACTSATDGALALTALYSMCVCNGSTSTWVNTASGTTACTW